MSIYERVQELAKEEGLTIKQLERDCDLANATIRRWATQTPNIESVRRVAHRLKVSIDFLVTGDSPNATDQALMCDGVALSPLESDLVAMFRLLPDDVKKEVFDLTHFKYTRLAGGEKESIFSTYFDESSNAKSDPADSHERRSGTA